MEQFNALCFAQWHFGSHSERCWCKTSLLPASSTQLEYCRSAIQSWESIQQPLVINQPHYLKDIFYVISSWLQWYAHYYSLQLISLEWQWDGIAHTDIITMINHRCLIFPQFSAVSCGNPGTPAHGRIVFSDGITFGSSVAYACWDGFKTSGLTTRHCTTNGTWTGQPPDCTGRLNIIASTVILLLLSVGTEGGIAMILKWSKGLYKLQVLLQIWSVCACIVVCFVLLKDPRVV